MHVSINMHQPTAITEGHMILGFCFMSVFHFLYIVSLALKNKTKARRKNTCANMEWAELMQKLSDWLSADGHI